MYRPDWHRTLQFFDGFENPQPHYLADDIALSRKCISPFHRLNGGTVPAVPVDHQLASASDVSRSSIMSAAMIRAAMRRTSICYGYGHGLLAV